MSAPSGILKNVVFRSAPVVAGAALGMLCGGEAFAAGGGTPMETGGQNFVDIVRSMGVLATAGAVMGTCAAGMAQRGGLMAAGGIASACGAGWVASPQVVTRVIGAAGGAGLSDLAQITPATGDIFSALPLILSIFA